MNAIRENGVPGGDTPALILLSLILLDMPELYANFTRISGMKPNQDINKPPEATNGNGKSNGGIKFADFFSPKHVLCQTEIAEWDETVRELLKLLAYENGIGNVDDAFRALLEREQEQSTVIAPGIAMPHARLGVIEKPMVAAATSTNGIAPLSGGGKINLLILILVPVGKPGLYLQIVSCLARLLQDPKAVAAVAALPSPGEVWKFFDVSNETLPDHLTAGNLMNKDVVKILQTDTLEHAINMFVRHNLVDLPVVDSEGDLVGIVSAHQLLRVALPEYLLWMEDLSPIIHFEPFASILRGESQTWLEDIMSMECATVQENAPAIQVAKEIAARNAREVFVKRGKKLVGVVTLQDFISKILRDRNA